MIRQPLLQMYSTLTTQLLPDVNVTDFNITHQLNWFVPGLKIKHYFLVLAFCLIFVVGVLGNILVCYVFGVRRTRRRSTTEWLILYLGVVDLLASLFNPPLYIYWTLTQHRTWHFGEVACKLLPGIGQVMTTASAGILLIIAVDRYMAIVMPFGGQFSFRTITIASFVNMIICFATYAHYMNTLRILRTGQCVIPDISVYSYSIPNCVFIILRLLTFTCVFIFTNIKIFTTLRRQKESLTIKELKEQRHKETQKIMRVLLIMGVVFVVLVFPRELFYLIFNLSWIDNDDGIAFGQSILNINSWLKVMHTANSCANVFIYAHMHEMYRDQVMRFFRCCNVARQESVETMYTMGTPLMNGDRQIQESASKTSPFFKRAHSWKERDKDVLLQVPNIGQTLDG